MPRFYALKLTSYIVKKHDTLSKECHVYVFSLAIKFRFKPYSLVLSAPRIFLESYDRYSLAPRREKPLLPGTETEEYPLLPDSILQMPAIL